MTIPPTEPLPSDVAPAAADAPSPSGASADWGPPAPEAPAKKPNTLVAALAGALPAIFTLFSCALFAGLNPERMSHTVREMGTLSLLMIVAATFGGVLLTTGLAFASAKGFRVPSALHVGSAALPWLAGLAGTMIGMRMVNRAVESADASSRSAMMAMGIAEASHARLFGTMLSSGLLSAVAFGLAIGSLNQGAKGRRLPIGAAVGLAALPLLAVCAYGALPAGLRGVVLVIAALGALLAIVLGSAGAGADAPHGRSGALAAAAPMAAALSVLGVALAVATSTEMVIFRALANAAPESRGELMAGAAAELGPLTLAARAALPLGLLAAGAVAAWAFTRAKPSVGQMVGAAALTLVVLSVSAGDLLVSRSITSSLDAAAEPPWSAVDGLEPVRMEGYSSGSSMLDGVVTPEGLFDAEGASLSALEAAPLSQAIRQLAATRESRLEANATRDPFYPDEEVPEWLDGPDADDGPDDEPPADGGRRAWEQRGRTDEGRLELALDSRLGPSALRVLFAALEAAEVPALVVHGADAASLDEEQRATVADAFPTIAPMLQGSRSLLVHTAPPAAMAERDRTLRHAVVGAETDPEIATRPGARREPERPFGRRGLGSRGERDSLVFLGIGDDASPQSLLTAAERIRTDDMLPVVVSGAIPGNPEQPLVAEALLRGGDGGGGGIGLGALGALRGAGDGSSGLGRGALGRLSGNGHERRPLRSDAPTATVHAGQTDVRGSLSREVIRRVVRQHMSQVRYCYESRLAANPNLAGRVTVSFIISPTGAVQTSAVRETTLNDSAVESCLTRGIRRWRFPEPDGGGIVAVNYPFVFSSR